MALGDDVGKKAVDELTTQTLPELIAAANALLDRLEKIVDRLNGSTVTLTVPERKQ